MTEKLKQKFNEEIIKMPKEVQDVLNSFNWGQVSEEIGRKYFLGESETNDLQVEVMLILIGMTSIFDLKINIENNIVTSKDEAEKIGDELLEKVFVPITAKITETIKKNLKDKEINWQQNLGFILSGGNYAAFLINTTNINGGKTKEELLVNFLKKQ